MIRDFILDPSLREYLTETIALARRQSYNTDADRYVSIMPDAGIALSSAYRPGCLAYVKIQPGNTESQITAAILLLAAEILKADEKICGDKSGLTETERALVEAGKFIPAIKEHRTRTGAGLRDSKDVVDAYRNSLPSNHPCRAQWR